MRENKPAWYGIVGAIILALYGVVATWQESNFAKVYAAYGGVFIVMSLLWAMVADKYTPSKHDIIGAGVILLGIYIIFYAPRP